MNLEAFTPAFRKNKIAEKFQGFLQEDGDEKVNLDYVSP